MNLYNLGESNKRYEELLEAGKTPSIQHELALIRSVLEKTMTMSEPLEFVLQSDVICKQVEQVRKIVETFHKLEEKNGSLLHKDEVLSIVMKIQSIIAKYCDAKTVILVTGELANIFNNETE